MRCEYGNELHAIHMIRDQLAAAKSSVLTERLCLGTFICL